MDKPKSYNMEEFRRAFGKEESMATCKECGRPTDGKHALCRECFNKQQAPPGPASRSGGPPGRPPARLPSGYLQNGYFEERAAADGKATLSLRPELIIDFPQQFAEKFAGQGLPAGQLRRFYSHARYAAQRLESECDFGSVLPAILEMRPLVAGAVGRASANLGADFNLFKQFIDANVELAAQSPENFSRGFVPHFQYVVAYFTYLKPRG